MTFVKAGAKHEFEAKAVGITKGAPAKFKISAYPAAGAKVLAEGDEEAEAGGVTHRWKAEGPPTDAANGVRSWRVAYEVTVDVARNGATTQLKAPSQEVDVFHDWIELKTVKEDGSAYPGAVFDVVVTSGGREIQREKSKSTGKTGVVKVTGLKGGDVSVVFKSPHLLVAWTSGTGCKLEAKVRAVPKATLVWPKTDAKAKHIQWVNLPADAAKKEQGSKCKLTFKLEGQVKAGDPVFVKTSYQAASTSPRSTHTRGIVSPDAGPPAWAGAAPSTGKKAAVVARNKGFEVDVEVECGIAGGDTITVAAGGTDACTDVKLSLVTRRKLRFELVLPTDKVSTLAKDGGGATTLAAITKALDPAGVEPEVEKKTTFDVADLPGAACVLDGAYCKSTAGSKVLILTPKQFLDLSKAKATHGADTAGLTQVVSWGDFIGFDGDPAAQSSDVIDSFFTDTTARKLDWAGKLAKFVLPHDPRTPSKPSVHAISWCTAGYQQEGEWIEYASEGTPLGTAGAVGPGGGKSAWQTVAISAENVAKYVDFVNHQALTIKCPAADANDPGKFLSAKVGDETYPVAVAIRIEVYWVSYSRLIGIAKDGLVGMTTGLGAYTAGGLAEMILHETGHNVGLGLIDRSNGSQAVPGGTFNYGQSKSPPSGPIQGLQFAELGADGKATGNKVDWPQPVPDGLVYVGKGHLGPHCASGLSRTKRDKPDYVVAKLQGSCLMFGSADPRKKGGGAFCPQCTAILRARDLADVRRKWPV